MSDFAKADNEARLHRVIATYVAVPGSCGRALTATAPSRISSSFLAACHALRLRRPASPHRALPSGVRGPVDHPPCQRHSSRPFLQRRTSSLTPHGGPRRLGPWQRPFENRFFRGVPAIGLVTGARNRNHDRVPLALLALHEQ